MESISNLLPALEGIGRAGYWLVLLVSFLESLAIVGAFIPGSLVIVSIGLLSSHGYLDIGDLIWFVAIGAILGDATSYWLGTKGERFFKNENRILKASHLDVGKAFFARHGDKSIFIGRFVGVVRPVVAFTAGLSRMHFGIFMLWNVTSAFLWAATYLLMGYFFADAFIVVEKWTGRVGIIVIALAALSAGAYFIFRKKPAR
jgi:membrane protein DedA with SNARE-associated domain